MTAPFPPPPVLPTRTPCPPPVPPASSRPNRAAAAPRRCCAPLCRASSESQRERPLATRQWACTRHTLPARDWLIVSPGLRAKGGTSGRGRRAAAAAGGGGGGGGRGVTVLDEDCFYRAHLVPIAPVCHRREAATHCRGRKPRETRPAPPLDVERRDGSLHVEGAGGVVVLRVLR